MIEDGFPATARRMERIHVFEKGNFTERSSGYLAKKKMTWLSHDLSSMEDHRFLSIGIAFLDCYGLWRLMDCAVAHGGIPVCEVGPSPTNNAGASVMTPQKRKNALSATE